jgi:hypothetical protein
MPSLFEERPVASALAGETRPPVEARRRLERLKDRREERLKKLLELEEKFQIVDQYLATADGVSAALDALGEQLFQKTLKVVEEKLTIALQEILEQPIRFVATAETKRGAATVEFSVERNGKPEDILRGQGGSVANVLSVGLRIAVSWFWTSRTAGFVRNWFRGW